MVPLPNCPYVLFPHVQTVPSDFKATVCQNPPATLIASLRLLTYTGTLLSVAVPSPNCPYILFPHVQTVPVVFMAIECNPPAAMGIVVADAFLTAKGTIWKNKNRMMMLRRTFCLLRTSSKSGFSMYTISLFILRCFIKYLKDKVDQIGRTIARIILPALKTTLCLKYFPSTIRGIREILHKIEVLKDTYPDEAELDRVLGKLLDVALSQHRMRLESAL